MAAFALLVPAWAASARPNAAAYLISDFEGAAALEGWRAEQAALSVGPGHRGQGAVLSYSFACGRAEECGPASAAWQASPPLPKMHNPAIDLWLKPGGEVDVVLQVKDLSGETLRLPVTATLEYPQPAGWQHAVLPLESESVKLKGRLAEVALLVRPRFRLRLEGSIAFDEVRLVESPDVFRMDASAVTEPPARESADLASRLGVNIHLLRDDAALDAARAAGFAFVRMDLQWSEVERRGRFRFFAYDALLRALEVRGMWALWILDYGHPEHGGSVPRTAQDVAAFGRFAEAAAEHFKGRNARYEIWNEPDTNQFWAPSPNAAEYRALLREAVTAIRRADPVAQISSGGVSRFDAPFLSRALDPSLAASLTAVGIHPYRRSTPEAVAPELALFREWAALALGEGVQVWDTEWGYSSADAVKDVVANGHSAAARKRQAVMAARELLTLRAVGLPLAVWYDLRDDGQDQRNPEHNYGLLDADGNEKPALAAIRNLAHLAQNRKYAGMLRAAPPGMHAMRFEGAADIAMVVWTDRPTGRRSVEFSTRDLVSATDVLGGAVQWKDRGSGRAEMQIDASGGPVCLLWNGGS